MYLHLCSWGGAAGCPHLHFTSRWLASTTTSLCPTLEGCTLGSNDVHSWTFEAAFS